MNYSLPHSVTVGGRELAIRWDFRAVLDILTALDDPELEPRDRAYVVLTIFYPDIDEMTPSEYQEALEQLYWFLNGGETDPPGARSTRLMDWEQDFPLIVAPVNRVLGRDVREDVNLHWWTFLSAYMEIGDCTYAQVVAIRDKQARGRSLDKVEREWYRRNKHLVDFRRASTQKYTRAERELLAKLL